MDQAISPNPKATNLKLFVSAFNYFLEGIVRKLIYLGCLGNVVKGR